MRGLQWMLLMLLLLATVDCLDIVEEMVQEQTQMNYCSFFNNREPKSQPGLKNCTWFKENSCCMQQEIEATFGRVKPLKGASLECQRYINYLMCYICAPNQNIFYKRERLTVCETFCDSLYSVCGSAILKGSVIRDLYPSGREFCLSRRFEVDSVECFTFDVALDTSTSNILVPSKSVVFLMLAFCILLISNIPVVFSKSDTANSILRDSKTMILKNKGFNLKSKKQTTKYSGVKCIVVVALVIFMTCIPMTNCDLTSEDVDVWAKKISAEINDVAEHRLHHKDIQQMYKQAQYATDYINGTRKLFELRDKLEKHFERKYRLVHKMAAEVQRLHDEWLTGKMSAVSNILLMDQEAGGLSSFLLGGGMTGSLYQHEPGVTEMPSDLNVTQRTLNDLPIEVYKDADLTTRMPPQYMTYSRRFGQMVMVNYSSVKIPDGVERDAELTVDTVEWSSQLEDTFRLASQADPEIMWQYFGSATGVYRTFPGHYWPSNFIGFPEDYDPRVRPWYIAAASGAKDVVLVLDGSLSMIDGGNLRRMRKIASQVLNTLTIYDTVNVVVSRSPYWDPSGGYHFHNASILGCRNNTLLAASPAYKQELISQIDEMDVYGGSDHIEAFRAAFNLLKMSTVGDCHSIIIFITDGNKYDRNHRCTPGYFKYDTESTRSFQSGELCAYDFQNVIQVVNTLQNEVPRRAHLFTFVTDSSSKSEILPGHLACNNQGAMVKVVDDANILDQMMPFYTFLAASSMSTELIWTSPYLDKGGLGLVITAALPVYSNITGKHIGVVAIDTPISFLDQAIKNSKWGDAYPFMIDSRSGSTILHPLTKSGSQLLGNPALVPITALETHGGQPAVFAQVLADMMQQETGDLLITSDAVHPTQLHDALVWHPAKSSHYFYTSVKYTDYSIAYHVSQPDETFQYARNPEDPVPMSYLHNMLDYAKLGPAYAAVLAEIKPNDTLPHYPGVNVSMQHSVVKLSPHSYCRPVDYLQADKPSLQDTHQYINAESSSDDSHCPLGNFMADVRPDVKMTAQLEPLWLHDWAEEDGLDVVWVYMGTMSGVFRIYPGVQLNKEFDTTKRIWYKRSEVNKGAVAVSSIFEDASGLGKVISLSKAIHKSRPHNPSQSDCSGPLRDYGCPCEYHYECRSGHCDMDTCTDDIIQGVVAMDIKYNSFHSFIDETIKDLEQDHYCGQHYTCEDSICETRCYLVDDSAHLVVAPDFLSMSASGREYEAVSLATRHGFIFSELLTLGVFTKHTRVEYQSKCVLSTFVPDEIPLERQWIPSYFLEGDQSDIPGPIPPFQNDYSCIKEVIYYQANKSYSVGEDYVISGSLSQDPCGQGSYYFTPVEGTNLYLLVLQDYMDHASRINLNCHIANKILSPGHYRMGRSPCEYGSFIAGHHLRRCNINTGLVIACGYGTAYSISPCLTLTAVITAMALLFTLHRTHLAF